MCERSGRVNALAFAAASCHNVWVTEIAFLADHLDCIPTLARWFRDEWPDYYGERSLAAIEDDFHRELNRDAIPMRLIAFEDGSLAGTAVLRGSALDGYEQYSPGLGGLYVHPSMRNRGIASALVAATTRLAAGLGLGDVYSATGPAQGLLERLGWRLIDSVHHEGEELGIYHCRS
jgi:GNAT superfamily N-acetyltransferase